MNWKRLREKILEKYYPDEEELEETEEIYQELAGYIQREHEVPTHFAGSAGRRTCMKGDKDIDLFLLFPEDWDRSKFENKALEIGKDTFNAFNGDFHIEYAEHPYVKGEIEGHEVEIVPCHDTDPTDIKSSVDRTPHHSRWVKDNLTEEQRKDVVILKVFLRANEMYGSSLKVRGFSGYLCEIMIHHAGSFEELMEQAENWSRDELIDVEGHHEELPDELKKKFDEDDLVVIDPVDPERNVASVMSTANYAKFMYTAHKFNEAPGLEFFEREETEFNRFELEQEIEDRADFLVLEMDNIEGVDDIVYPQLRKTQRRLEQVVRKNDFRIFESGFHVSDERTRFFFELDRQLPEIADIQGPSVFHGLNHIDQFEQKYDNTFIRDDRLYAKTEREYSDAKELLQSFLEADLKEKGIPGNVAEKLEAYKFSEPLAEDEKWLKYLTEKLHVNAK